MLPRCKSMPDIASQQSLQLQKAKKAQIARECRQRKKEYIKSLETRVLYLQNCISSIKQQYGIVEPEIPGNSTSSYIEDYSSQTAEKNRLYRKIIECIRPGAQVKFLVWALDQNDAFYANEGIWKTITRDVLHLDDSVVERLLEYREQISKDRRKYSDREKKLKVLFDDMETHFRDVHVLTQRLMERIPRHVLCGLVEFSESKMTES